MFEKIKNLAQENPDRTKKLAIAAGALVGVVAAGVVIYLKGVELPWAAFDQIENTNLVSE